ncbi:hypothetical protein RB620_25535 [Paenibacillus sp. LHD-117]|uniref:hypothetical protein n=1 Tax=Paenibacillus sp. LHD-117 TaxID=3071412 RepID=UPI0027E15339|nr:hypothetical protein [Paenibacillus sp. LHD-117]MDQ6422794.1 hypothetical protein [Paenibacillus sp. LHD-117]
MGKKLFWSDWLIVVGFVLWFWGSEIVKKYAEKTWFEPVLAWLNNNFMFSVPFWSVFFFAGTFVAIFLRYHQRRVAELETLLEDEKRIMSLLNEEQRPLQLRYLLGKAARSFVERNPYAIAAQLFHYEIMIGRGNTRIAVKNIGEYAREGENVNIFSQHYYNVPTRLYQELREAQKALASHDLMPAILMAERLQSRLRAKSAVHYTGKDAVEFAFCRIALGMMATYLDIRVDYELPEDKAEKLDGMLRSGILMAILMQTNYYVFSNHGSDEKRDRVYYATEIQMPRERMLALIIFSPGLHDESSRFIDETMTEADQVLRELLARIYYNGKNDAGGGRNHG